MARPTKFTPELGAKIVSLVSAGNYPDVAAQACGVCPATFYKWQNLGRAGKKPFAEFSDSITRARATSESRAVALISKGALTDPRHAQWLLERSNPRRWGPRVQVSVQAELDAALTRLEARLDPRTYDQVLAVLADGHGSEEIMGEEETR